MGIFTLYRELVNLDVLFVSSFLQIQEQICLIILKLAAFLPLVFCLLFMPQGRTWLACSLALVTVYHLFADQ
jgi:hypothetical protein